jgi:hypothetical protein
MVLRALTALGALKRKSLLLGTRKNERMLSSRQRNRVQHIPPTANALRQTLLALQAFQVLFLWLHDWVPLGRLNDVAAVRREDPPGRLVVVTLVQSVPWTVGLFFSAWYFGRPYPAWLTVWLWTTYVLLFAGQLRAWWVPCLLRPEPQRAQRFQRMFGNTHSFLPKRNGMVSNTAHILLHLATAGTLLVLALRPVGTPPA